LPIPPYPMSFMTTGRRRGPILELSFGPDLTDAAHHNRLLALDAETGKLLWEIGGRGEEAAGPWSDSHFLGPPLALDGLLYAVLEKNQELRLVCLDAAQGGFLWKQALAVPMNRVVRDVGRRLDAVSPAYGDGMLICATNAGVVLGVDLFHRGLAWAYVYREDVLPQDPELGGWGFRGRYGPRVLPRLRKDWKAAAPVICGDRVIITAPDTAAVHCLDLRSGTLLWKAERVEDDVYLAGVVSDKVVIVGKQSCRALRLADGRPLWRVQTGLPSGQGVIAGNMYYLPLKTALPEKRPGVYAVDLDQGTILERIAAPPGELPGNLILHSDTIVSQSVLAVSSYPQRKVEKEGGN
jgi:outer membrane protein assembly factor BamB